MNSKPSEITLARTIGLRGVHAYLASNGRKLAPRNTHAANGAARGPVEFGAAARHGVSDGIAGCGWRLTISRSFSGIGQP